MNPNDLIPLKELYKGASNIALISLNLRVKGSSFHDQLMLSGTYCLSNGHK